MPGWINKDQRVRKKHKHKRKDQCDGELGTDLRPVERLMPARNAEIMSASAVRWTIFPSMRE